MNLRNRQNETIVYGILWILVVGLYLLDKMRSRAQLSLSLFDLRLMTDMISTLLPFFVLFLINNYFLIPRLLLYNRIGAYLAFTAGIIIIIWCYQFVSFTYLDNNVPPMPHEPDVHRPMPHSFLPMPLIMDFTYALLTVGGNLAIALLFQRIDDKLEKESLRKANAENELSYLKSQINPHFYMNMLNNIHGMIEIDPFRAQKMVIDMSKLMRFMLYDSSKPMISLSEEIEFLNNYIELMRLRFDKDKVKIRTSFPDKSVANNLWVPPLIFLVFIENAFKHGISYRDNSFISIEIKTDNDSICFNCMNSNRNHRETSAQTGIGLINIRQRLRLLYGNRAKLELIDSSEAFTVNLIIPTHETTDSNNR